MATTQSLLPQQQDPQVPSIPQAVATNNQGGYSSGSIGPFFAVISVLAVLAILSCFLGRMCTGAGRDVFPLESVGHRGCWGWLNRRCRRCMYGHDVEVGVKVMALGEEKNDAKVKHGQEVQQPREN